MIGTNMHIEVYVMISILKQQELDVEEVTATIHGYIQQFCRSELRSCIPEIRGILVSLLQKQLKCTKHLENLLGEDHPVTMLWTQREDLLLQVANEALHLSYVVLRSCEEDRHSEGTAEAHAATADTMQPAVVKVKVCSVELDDAAASNLPVGKVASGGFTVGTDTATRPCRPQATPAEREETQPVAGLQAADATQPATLRTLRTAGTTPPAENKVQVKTTIEASCASPHLPVGKLASGGHPATVETAPRLQTAAEVQDCYSYRTAGTTPPAAYQVSCGGLSAET